MVERGVEEAMKLRFVLAALGCAPGAALAIDDRPGVEPPREAVEARQKNELMSKDIQINSRQQKSGGSSAAVREQRRAYREAERAHQDMRASPPDSYPQARERADDRMLDLDRRIQKGE
jgi:hypothetical protein